ncbi:hypothetical protein ACE7GA_02940 [Roseomonas sp. CCTCC AB2023176]|uniref:hypothetical protein n=1 Tax=Roseomonas sp. CCTCC AB2023176 TaxID=3342640 RepID=UPI0035DE40EC
MQARDTVGRLDGAWGIVVLLTIGTCVAVIARRVAWAVAGNAGYRLRVTRHGPPVARGRRILGPTLAGGLPP